MTPQAAALHRLMQKLPTYDGTVWRGFRVKLDDALLAQYAPGTMVEADAFWSTSRNRFQAGRFARGEGVILEIRGGGGRDISIVSRYPKQREVLFAPGMRFRILSVRRDGAILHVVIQKEPNE